MENESRTSDNVEWGAYPAQALVSETRDSPAYIGEGKQQAIDSPLPVRSDSPGIDFEGYVGGKRLQDIVLGPHCFIGQ